MVTYIGHWLCKQYMLLLYTAIIGNVRQYYYVDMSVTLNACMASNSSV